jgi:hypothetical protein
LDIPLLARGLERVGLSYSLDLCPVLCLSVMRPRLYGEVLARKVVASEETGPVML